MLGEIFQTLKKHQGKIPEKQESVFDTVNDTVKLIRANPDITMDELAKKLGKSRSTVIRLMKKLQADGTVRRIGSDKTGYWQVCP